MTKKQRSKKVPQHRSRHEAHLRRNCIKSRGTKISAREQEEEQEGAMIPRGRENVPRRRVAQDYQMVSGPRVLNKSHKQPCKKLKAAQNEKYSDASCFRSNTGDSKEGEQFPVIYLS